MNFTFHPCQKADEILLSHFDCSLAHCALARVYIWRTPKEAYDPDCLIPTVKHGGGSVMVWVAISWYSVGPVITMTGKVTADVYKGILGTCALCGTNIVSFRKCSLSK